MKVLIRVKGYHELMADFSVGMYSPLSKLALAVSYEEGCKLASAVSKVNSVLFKDCLKRWMHNQDPLSFRLISFLSF